METIQDEERERWKEEAWAERERARLREAMERPIEEARAAYAAREKDRLARLAEEKIAALQAKVAEAEARLKQWRDRNKPESDEDASWAVVNRSRWATAH
jgi:hypothetical protein